MTDSLRNLTETLLSRRTAAAALSQVLRTSKAQWQADNQELIDESEAATARMGDADDALRTHALILYHSNAERKIGPGVEIKEKRSLSYDHEVALQWAKDHRICLGLNIKQFENVAKAIGLPFVEERIDAMAFISTDLENILAGAPEEPPAEVQDSFPVSVARQKRFPGRDARNSGTHSR